MEAQSEEYLRPRERLMRAVSAEELSDEDLLAVLLRTGSQNCPVEEMAGRLSIALRTVLDDPHAPCDWRSLSSMVEKYNLNHPARPIKGVGPVKLLELAAALELSHRRYHRVTVVDLARISLRSSPAAFDLFWRVVARHHEQENFFVLPMDAGFHPLCEPIAVTKGGVSAVTVHPREVFCEAIRWRAHAVIVAHNHPSGDATPSEQDVDLTRKLIEAAKIVHIPILDHLVITTGGFTSIRSLAVLSFA